MKSTFHKCVLNVSAGPNPTPMSKFCKKTENNNKNLRVRNWVIMGGPKLPCLFPWGASSLGEQLVVLKCSGLLSLCELLARAPVPGEEKIFVCTYIYVYYIYIYTHIYITIYTYSQYIPYTYNITRIKLTPSLPTIGTLPIMYCLLTWWCVVEAYGSVWRRIYRLLTAYWLALMHICSTIMDMCASSEINRQYVRLHTCPYASIKHQHVNRQYLIGYTCCGGQSQVCVWVNLILVIL